MIIFDIKQSVVAMADLLTKGCIEKLVSGECPESFTVQVQFINIFCETN